MFDVANLHVVFIPSEILITARRAAGLSIRDLAERADRSVSTVSRIEAGGTEPSATLLAELLEQCGWRLTATPTDPNQLSQQEDLPMPTAPSTYPNPRNDDPWDNDAVHWLLEQPGVAASWKRGPLFECLRRQPGRVRNEPHRVVQAARLAAKYGVEQRDVYDPIIGKKIVRVIRHDAKAPQYPW